METLAMSIDEWRPGMRHLRWSWDMRRALFIVVIVFLGCMVPEVGRAAYGGGPGNCPTADASSCVLTATGSTTSIPAGDRAAWQQDVRNWFTNTVADCAIDVSTAVNAAVTAGVKRLYIPAHCIYKPTSNTTPSDVTLIGEDWQTTIISVANRATDNLSLGARSGFQNMAIVSLFCDATAPPALTQKTCPVGTARNNSDTPTKIYTYRYNDIWAVSGPVVTLDGVASSDLPGLSSTAFGAGTDAIYAQTGGGDAANAAAGAAGLRTVTAGDGDIGVYILDGSGASASSNAHRGIFIDEQSNNTTLTNGSIVINRDGDGTDVSRSLVISDTTVTGSPTFSQNVIDLSSAHQGAGNFINLFQTTTPFSGNAIMLNLGNSGGTFTGNFLQLDNNGAIVAFVDHNADAVFNGAGLFGSNALQNLVGGGFAKLTTSSLSGVFNQIDGKWTADTAGASSACIKSRNTTPGSHTTVNSGDTLCHYFAYGDDGTNYLDVGEYYWGVIGSPSAGKIGTQFVVVTNNSSSGAAVNSLILNGNTSNATFAGGITATLATAGTIAGSVCATSAGIILYESGATGCTISLAELKDIKGALDADEAWKTLATLSPIDFSMKPRERENVDTHPRLGFTAQNALAANPRLATYDGDGNLQGYDPNGIVAALVVAVKAQQSTLRWYALWLLALSVVVASLGASQVITWRRVGRR